MISNTALFPYTIFEDNNTFLWIVVSGGRRELSLGSYVCLMRDAHDNYPIGDLEVVMIERISIAMASEGTLEFSDNKITLADIVGADDQDMAIARLQGFYNTRFGPDSNFTIICFKQPLETPLAQAYTAQPGTDNVVDTIPELKQQREDNIMAQLAENTASIYGVDSPNVSATSDTTSYESASDTGSDGSFGGGGGFSGCGGGSEF